jgi:hypothetical protein
VQRSKSAAREGASSSGLADDAATCTIPETLGPLRPASLGGKHWARIAARATGAGAGYALIGGLAGACCGVALWEALRLTGIVAAPSSGLASPMSLLTLLYAAVGIAAGAIVSATAGTCVSLRRAIVDEGEVRRIATALERAMMRCIERDAENAPGNGPAEPSYAGAMLRAAEVVELAESIIRDNGDSSSERPGGVPGRIATVTESLLMEHYDRLFLDGLRAAGDDGLVTLSQVRQWAVDEVEGAVRAHLNQYARSVCLGTILVSVAVLAIPVVMALGR